MLMARVSPHNFLVSLSFLISTLVSSHVLVKPSTTKAIFWSSFSDLTRDKEELHNVVLRFPDVKAQLDKQLRNIVDYPKVSTAVHHYNKKAFGDWRKNLGINYSLVIANLRWHVDWQKDVLSNERAIDRWLYGSL